MGEKTRQICFQVDPETYRQLEALAGRQGVSMPDLVKELADAFIRRKAHEQDQSEQREFNRNHTSLPVVVQLVFEPGESFYRTGTILDISMGGVRIRMPSHEHSDKSFFDRCQSVEILFRLPGEDYTVTFRCKPARIQSRQEEIELGAEFTDADLRSQQVLHKYFM